MASKITPTIVVLAVAGLFLTVITSAALSDSTLIPLNGTITTVNVDAYTDAACTIPCTSLNAGNIAPGSTVTQTIYIKNNGTVPVTLTMAVSNWNPTTASSYLTLSWNRQNYVLNAGLSVQANLTLTAAPSTGSLTTFSCTVTITGTN